MSDTMAAAVYEGDRTISVRSVPVPAPPDDGVVVEVSHCGICGSDLHFVVEGWSRPGSIHGHEWSGVVVATGPAADGWRVGDRVVGGPGPGCGACPPCGAGLDHLCHHRDKPGVTPSQGAFAQYKALGADCLFRIPDAVELRVAALTEPLAVALRGVRRSGAGPGARVLVMGAGPIGMLTVAVLRSMGVEDITVCEPAPLRQRRALEVGAASAVVPADLTLPGMPMDLVAEPFDAAIECSGRAEAMEAALAQLGRRGTLVFSGTGMRRPALDALRVILNELVVTGSFEYTAADFQGAIDMLAAGSLPVDLLIEPDDVPLSGVQLAMERLAAGELAGKVMVVPRA